MGKINWGRIILGGLLAGVIINIFEYVANGIVLAADWEAAMKALNREMPPSAIPIFFLGGFVTGIAAIWLYAVARPRFGPGPRTAALTGFGYWIIGYAIPALGFCAMGIFPPRLIVIGTLVGLVEIILASVAGAWPYKEQVS